ncbi:restriction endonuclease subunit S [Streptococcus thermophilus]|uniref:restriction endonuclease subunit S n=1 Tax=Streptococcus thermophilus TaxID=1308 RepID=UPI002301FFC6|nr:restriction endonuclease subunit S [Streptococcus thermophilus]MCE2272650.1 restriction endonuclease subunit S [Streptococcus thermophilus]MDA5503776.1 restriction endonuclease subunit S [Streptococcus thermophilus]
MINKVTELKLKVRNKGYSGEVSRKLLKELVSLNGRIGFRGYTKNDIVERSNGVLTYSPTNIVNNKIVNYKNDTYISQDKYKESPEIMVKNNDILFVKTGSTLGKSALVRNLTEPATINPQLIVIKTIHVDSDYLAVYLLTDSIQKQVFQVKIGGAVPTLTETEIGKFVVKLPPLPEQTAIGSLFRTLDDLLTSYKDNLANYQSLKATMLSKMFPKVGHTAPEIRLDGFEGEWKKSKLRDVSERVQGNDGRMDLPTLTISASGGWMNQIERFSANIAGKEQKNYTLLKKGELSYNHGNSKLAKYGVVFELQDYEEALVPKVYHSFRVNQLADAKFIEIMFSSKIPDRELGKLVSSGARMDGLLNISFDDFMNIAIIIPTIEEQQAIGSYFSKLDQLITSYREKITQLETLKKKLLQDMFI